MPQEALAFLSDNRIGVLAVETSDGALHAATIHFAYRSDPLAFVFLTDRSTRKAEPMRAGDTVQAALVIGTDEAQMKTLQIHGHALITDIGEEKEIYLARFPERRAWSENPAAAFIVLTPSWWRYSDLKAPGGKFVIES